jgi:uracil phosphoribosyltransferase
LDLTVVSHPLARHYLTVLRDKNTDPEAFRAAARRLTYTLIIESTTEAPLTAGPVETPLTTAAGHEIGEFVAVAVLRAGLGMLDAVIDLIPHVKVGYAGVQRNEETAQPEEYYVKFPTMDGASVLVLEPMLATGGSLSWAVDKVKEAGATNVTALCCVAAPEGAKRMEADHPDVRIFAASLDEGLNESYYIVPGLGDMGDRLFGTV